MLSFDIRTLSQGAITVAGDLTADDAVWADDDVRPVKSVHVTGRLSGAGSDRYYFSGTLKGVAAGECRRCLTAVETEVSAHANFLYADADDENADEPDVYPMSDLGTALDLKPAVRELWLLEVPSLPLCKPDCLGLCPNCGADLNAGPHDCPKAAKAETAGKSPKADKLKS